MKYLDFENILPYDKEKDKKEYKTAYKEYIKNGGKITKLPYFEPTNREYICESLTEIDIDLELC